MSAGNFETAKYEQDGGTNIWPCRAQPETKQLSLGGAANAYPAGPVTNGLPRLKLRKGKRERGLPIRTVTVKLTADGAGETGEYENGSTHVVPVFQESIWDGYSDGQVGTYLGIACECVGKSAGY